MTAITATPAPISQLDGAIPHDQEGLRRLRPPIAVAVGPTVFDDARFSLLHPSFDVDGGAARIVAAYDRDGDGAIDVAPSHRHPMSVETARHDGHGIRSIEALAFAADALGNGDGRMTVEEAANLMRSFDRQVHRGGTATYGADGLLSMGERTSFLARYGERPANHLGMVDVAPAASTLWSSSIERPRYSGESTAHPNLDARVPYSVKSMPRPDLDGRLPYSVSSMPRPDFDDRLPYSVSSMPRPDFDDRLPYPLERLELLAGDIDVFGEDRPLSAGGTA